MFDKIMVPVDLAHLGLLEPSLHVAADQARHYGAEICYVSVASATPGPVARTPDEYRRKLEAFARERSEVHGQGVSTRVITSADPSADLDDLLVEAIDDVGADMVVMSTHPPRHQDVVIPSHGGKIARHTTASVFLVRHAQT